MTEVYDRIYISNGEEACNVELLRANDIKALVCVALEFKSRHDAIRRESPVIYTAWQGMHDEYPGGTRNTDQQILDAVTAFRTLYENVGVQCTLALQGRAQPICRRRGWLSGTVREVCHG